MFRIIFLISFICFWCGVHAVHGQAPIANFYIDPSGCLNQNLVVQNLSTNATSYTWDFCFLDLNTVKEVQEAITVNAAVSSTGISFFSQNGNWFGFVSSRDNNKLFRLDFGISLENTPSIVDLGNIGGLLSGPQSLVFIEEDNTVYGILSNYNGSSLLRLSFPSGLSGVPLAQNLGSFGVVTPRGVDLVKDASNNITVAVADDNSKIVLIDFGTSILNNPTLVNAFEVAVGAGTRPIGIRLMNDGNNWFGFTSLFSGNVIKRIDFGSSLSSSVTLTDIYSVVNPTEISFQMEGLTTHLLVATMGGNVHHLKGISKPIDQIEASNLGRFGVLGNLFAFAVTRSAPIWYGFAIDYISNIVSRIKFQGDCVSDVAINDSNQNTPPNILYKSPGNYMIELTAYSTTEQDVDQQQITIQNVQAPIIVITTNNECVNSQVTFQADDSSGLSLTSHSWDFGDGHTSTISIPSNQYGNTGTYSVTLDATASNSCTNRVIKQLQIFNPPTASFLLPTGNPLCTNQNLKFTNTSLSDTGSSPSWQWYVNDVAASTSKDLNFAFISAVNQSVKLRASIPGCFTEATQIISTLLAGPNVDFEVIGKCQEEVVQFKNLTTDLVNGFNWDFGDTQQSTSANPTHIYPTIGSYSITLTADAPNGCLNSKVKAITIYSKPHPDFSLDLPPFSCSGSPSQFNDLTPPPTDSNISSWVWDFGDAANGASSIQNAQYTYTSAGHYSVSLTVTTNFGCSGTVQKAVTIQQSPLASFTNSTACVNQSTNFVDTSTGNIKSRLWTIEGSTYSTTTVSKTFTTPGSFQSQLTVTGNNNCVATVTKAIPVPVPPSLNFSMENGCSGQNAIFTDTTPIVTDPVSTRLWDFANQGNATGASAEHVFSSVGAYGVKLTVTNQSGCSYSLMKQVAITKTPTANFTPSPEDGPAPLLVKSNNASTDATSYLWQFNDAAGSMSTEHSPSFTYTALGNYLVELTAISLLGCQDKFSREVNVIVPYPDLSIDEVNIIKNAATGTIKMSVSIHNKGNSIISGTSLLIDASGGSLLKENVSNTIRPGETVVYVTHAELVMREDELNYLCAEVNASGDIDVSNNMDCLLVDDETVYFPAYPNPSQGQLFLEWIANQGASAYVLIVNSFGQKVFSAQIDATREGLNQFEFDVSNFSAGEYILTLQFEDTKKYFRFTVI